MAEREAANANAIDRPFAPIVAGWAGGTIPNGYPKGRIPPMQQHLSLNYKLPSSHFEGPRRDALERRGYQKPTKHRKSVLANLGR